jgi:hypothetical protein
MKIDLKLRQAVVFAILMEGNGGILNKAPVYIREKTNVFNMDDPEVLLDFMNMQKYNVYIDKWLDN